LGPLARVEDGEIRIEFAVPAEFEGFEGVVHGGIVGTILDEAFGFTCTRVHEIRGAVTVNLNLTFKAPVPTVTPIEVRARSAREGRKFHCSGEILDADGKVLAEATSLWILPANQEASEKWVSEVF
ncbi:MAG: PaaI family thioesterase, partial [Acidimicrobiia bacterium]